MSFFFFFFGGGGGGKKSQSYEKQQFVGEFVVVEGLFVCLFWFWLLLFVGAVGGLICS